MVSSIERPATAGDLAVKGQGRGRDERHAEKVPQDVPGLAIGNLQVVPQVRGHGPGERPDLTAGQFPLRRLIDRPPALGAPTLPMHEPGSVTL
jgi:hypothetical protein